VLLDSACGVSYDKKSEQMPAKEDHIVEETKEDRKKQPVETVSVEIQTDPITDLELLSLQQQKM